MEVEFRTPALEKCYESFREGQRQWGPLVARRYIQRVEVLYAADAPADLYRIPPLRLHALKGNRAGQYALWLDPRMRLIVTFRGEAPVIVRIEEVSERYGD